MYATLTEAAKRLTHLGVSRSRLKRWVQTGQVQARGLNADGSGWRLVDVDEVARLAEQRLGVDARTARELQRRKAALGVE